MPRLRSLGRARLAALLAAAAVLGAAPGPARAETFTVNSNLDDGDGTCTDGTCTLRDAIVEANASPGPHTIQFGLPLEGTQTIRPDPVPLPAVTSDDVTIDGLTLAGTSCDGAFPVLRLQLNGQNAGAGAVGLELAGANGSVRGLIVNRFAGDGIRLSGSGTSATCSIVGTNAAADAARPNGTGIRVTGSAASIGGPADDGNVIAGNTGAGIEVESTGTGLLVEGNLIGTPAGAPLVLGNGGSGVYLIDVSDALVLENGFADNGAGGVWVFGPTAQGNTISRNAMVDNADEGINLLGDPPFTFEDPIDPGDDDEGPNRRQNPPEISSATVDAGGQVRVAYRVDTAPENATYPITVEFFRNDDVSDVEGSVFVGSDVFSAEDFASGSDVVASFASAEIALDDELTGTATDADGNTSEFPVAAVIVPEPGAALAGLAACAALAAARRRRF